MLVSSLNMLTAAKILQLPSTYHPLLPSLPTAGAAAVVTADATRPPLKRVNHNTALPQQTLAPKTTTTTATTTVSITATLAPCKTYTQGGKEALRGQAVEG